MITTNTNSTVKSLLGNILLVEWLEQKQYGVIMLPDCSMHNPTNKVGIQAKVLMIGSKFQHPEVKAGMIVIVSKYLGTIIDKTKEHIRIYDAEDILAIV